jgi:hypothetical protein
MYVCAEQVSVMNDMKWLRNQAEMTITGNWTENLISLKLQGK